MNKFFHTIELIVDILVPFCLILIVVVLVMDLFFQDFVSLQGLTTIFDAIDYAVIIIFILDLVFKYTHVRSIPKFLRMYWLDIISVLPFYLAFRLVSVVTDLSKMIRQGAEYSRSEELAKYVEPVFKAPRFIKDIPSMLHFYDNPKKSNVDTNSLGQK